MRLDTRGNNIFQNFGDVVQIRNKSKVVEIVIRKSHLNEDGKFFSDKEKLMILMIVGPSSLKQSFKRKVGIESSIIH